MSVDSYLALFTTFLGWEFYNLLWDVLVSTGIAFIPFIGIIISNIMEPSISQEAKDAASTSLRRMEWDLGMAFLVITLAAAPYVTMNVNLLEYEEPTGNTVTSSTEPTTYGDTGFRPMASTVEVPILWYVTMAASAGINHAVITGLPAAVDLRGLDMAARKLTITDPALKQEINEFYTQCFVPARTKYLEEKPPLSTALVGVPYATLQEVMDELGPKDTSSLHSYAYRGLPGYYDTLRSEKIREGFAFDPARDTEWDPTITDPEDPMYPPPNGRPYCKEWWEDPNVGLQKRILDLDQMQAFTAQFDLALNSLSYLVMSEEEKTYAEISQILNQTNKSFVSDFFAENNTATEEWGALAAVENTVKNLINSYMLTGMSAAMDLTLQIVLHALPMVQALLLMSIYTLLPLMLVVGRYRLNVIVAAMLAIFTIYFWTVLWYLAWWVDQNLYMAMYPDASLLDALNDPFDSGNKRMILNLVTTALYIGLPLIWSAMMAWAGAGIMQQLQSAVGSKSFAKPMKTGLGRLVQPAKTQKG